MLVNARNQDTVEAYIEDAYSRGEVKLQEIIAELSTLRKLIFVTSAKQ